MKKRILSTLLCATMLVSMTACGSKPADTGSTTAAPAATTQAAAEAKAETTAAPAAEPAADAIVLTYAEVNPLDTIVGMTGQKFKEEVESRSNGSIIIDIQASGVLGSENEVLDGMLGGTGTVDISRISAFALTSYGGEKSKLLSLPYTFVSRDHFWKFAESDLAREFLDEPSQNGTNLIGLFYGAEGFRHFFTKDPVSSIDDFKGKKIVMGIIILSFVLPSQITMIPTYVLYSNLGILNTIWAFILPALFAQGFKAPIFILIFWQFFRQIPKALIEASRIDGAGHFKSFFRIALPSAKPAFITVALFSFVWYWNESYLTELYVHGVYGQSDWTTLVVQLDNFAANFSSYQQTATAGATNLNESINMSGTLLSILPLLILYFVLQRHFVESIDRTGITGE